MEDKNEKTLEEQVAWNLSAQLVEQISILLLRGSQAFLEGKIIDAFYSLVSVKNRFIQNLNKHERKTLRIMESKFVEMVNSSNPDDVKQKMSKMYALYNEKIMDLLEQYGYTIPKTKSSIGME